MLSELDTRQSLAKLSDLSPMMKDTLVRSAASTGELLRWLAAMPFLDQLELAAVSALEPFIEFKSQETCSNGAGSQAFGPSGWPATCATPPRAATHRLYASATPPALCTVPRPRQPVPRPLVQLRHCRWSR